MSDSGMAKEKSGQIKLTESGNTDWRSIAAGNTEKMQAVASDF
jgi:hypothetical protein